MGIRGDFNQFIDSNNLNTPAPCMPVPGQKGSDNGPSFTSEYYIILKKNGQLTEQDKIDYAQKIGQCIGPQGLLNRVPLNQSDGAESVDDYYAVTNGCVELGNKQIPRKFLLACIEFKGSFDNLSPGTWSWSTFLIRQPQLLAAIVSASFPSFRNPFHYLARFLVLPFYLVAAGSILIANINDPISDSNSRRLAWHLMNNTKKTSLMCWLASKVWMWRLKRGYPNLMKDVAALYYYPQKLNQNPYSKYWIS